MPQPYKTSAVWTEATLPAAIRGRHNTKAGVWGLLRVLEGEVTLIFHEPARSETVTPGRPALIPPEEWHHVEVAGPMAMQVEFYREHPLGGEQ